jgi:beta-fructofuranosidase
MKNRVRSSARSTAQTSSRTNLGDKRCSGSSIRRAEDPMRPRFHLLPAANWMNDPNGPIYFNGQYHMFYQYNPHAAVWGDMHWAHSISSDMIHWTHLPDALGPTSGGPDEAGCFSGSVIAIGKRVYVVYTGVVESSRETATVNDGKNSFREAQCLAWSDHRDLRRWSKLPNPIISHPPPGLVIKGFRDPSVWRQGSQYYMVVGVGMPKRGGILLYRSNDLKRWTYLHLLFSSPWNSTPSVNPVDSGEMWECPEIFKLDGKSVLIYSTERKVFWKTGRLDTKTMQFRDEKQGQLDEATYYAPKTQLDKHGRRILWGWIPESRPETEYSDAGWAGLMSLPRVLRVDDNGTLRYRFLPQLKTLRDRSALPVIRTESDITATLSEASGEFLISRAACAGDFRVRLSSAIDQKTIIEISYSFKKWLMIIDGKKFRWDDSFGSPQIHAYVDRSVIELIVNERFSYTKRFYCSQSNAPDITVQISGEGNSDLKLRAWKIRSI